MYVVFDLFSVVEAHIIKFQNNDTRFQITPEDGGLSKAVMDGKLQLLVSQRIEHFSPPP